MSRSLILIGFGLILIGVFWSSFAKIGLGRLPGDVLIKTARYKLYLPVTTCFLLSLIGSLILWLTRR